ncbi:hypothetical protein BH11MYX4_BH11MYX4_09270 [soil metagenome]
MEQAGPGPVVLVVDDDDDHAFTLAALLELEGFVALMASSRAEARAILASRPVDVLLADLSLGDGTALDLMRELGSRPRVAIVLSGFDGAGDVERTLAAGFDAHLTKPVHLPLLRDTIASGLRLPEGAACADPRFRRASRE